MIANLSAGVTALDNAQRGLQVTGQNLTNVNTEGYSRRRAEFKESCYSTIGASGTSKMQVGTGVDIRRIVQMRNTLLDQSYRNETSKMSFYDKEYEILHEVESLLIDSTDFSATLDDLYGAISILSQNCNSISAKAHLVESAENFIYEAKYISKQLSDMQFTMNEEITKEVDKANALLKEIYILNEDISKYEILGDEAADLRDQRNVALDKLSQIIPITVTEGRDSKVQVYTNGRDLYGVGSYETISIAPTKGVADFVTPIWIPAGDEVVNMNKPLNEDANYQDGGTLKGLLLGRGNIDATYVSSEKDTALYTIPSIKKEFDYLINKVVTRINDALAPESHTDGPYSADKSQYVELFSRVSVERYTLTPEGNYVYNEEDPEDYFTLYTIDNIVINKELLEDNDFNKLCISPSGAVGDNTLLEKLLVDWKQNNIVDGKGTHLSFESYLVNFLSNIATKAGTSKNNFDNQTTLVSAIDAERQAKSGVSLDEELSTLIRFQHSYSAASRVIQTIDSMLETLIFSMGM